MTCSNCAHVNPAEALFCGQCGALISRLSPATTSPQGSRKGGWTRTFGFGLIGLGGVLAVGFFITAGNNWVGIISLAGALIVGLPLAVPGALFVAASNAPSTRFGRVLRGLGWVLLGLGLAALIALIIFIIWIIWAFRNFD